MDTAPSPVGPATLLALGSAPLDPVDLLGRQRIVSGGVTDDNSESEVRKAAASAFATIEENHFKYKSLSSWAYNIAAGCLYGCRFCYVPDSQQTGRGRKKENTGPLATILRQFRVLDADADWGKYLLLRPWEEKTFLSSLRKAEKKPLRDLKRDGNRAIILCSSTDPYQTVSIPGNPAKQNLLNDLRRHLVRRALELILESTLNVRILTRSRRPSTNRKWKHNGAKPSATASAPRSTPSAHTTVPPPPSLSFLNPAR